MRGDPAAHGRISVLKKTFPLLLASAAILLAPFVALASEEDAEDAVGSKQVLSRYLTASESHADYLRGTSTEVEIDASVPKLKKEGRLKALRSISKIGKITYKVLGFQGDTTIKNEVIARYLEAEQQNQNNQKLAINKDNYKFKYKGMHTLHDGSEIFVFFLSPRKRQIGLFKGEMWLDTKTYLPVMEKGRLVKNPSIFFKRVEFVRDYKIENGTPVPQHMDSTIDARVVGKVTLSIAYSKPAPESPVADEAGASSAAPTPPSADQSVATYIPLK
jgi:hypothetical protein